MKYKTFCFHYYFFEFSKDQTFRRWMNSKTKTKIDYEIKTTKQLKLVNQIKKLLNN